MKKISTFILFLALCQQLFCQQWNVRFDAGYGLYKLNEIKDFQLNLRDYYSTLGVMALEKFPDNLFYALSADYNLNKKDAIGIAGSYYSTGGRNHVKDYSGEYKLDLLLNCFSLGFRYRGMVCNFNKYFIFAQLESGMHFSTLTMDERLTVSKETLIGNNYTFISNNFYGEPSLGFSYSYSEKINFNLSLGYEYDFKGNFHEIDDRNAILTNLKGDNVHVDWSGLRTSLGVSFLL